MLASDIANCTDIGIYMKNGVTANIENTTIQTCDWPIRYDGTASVIFSGVNYLTNNTHDGIYIYTTSCNSMAFDTVAIPYVLRTDFTINDGETLTIAPTNVVKSMGGHLYVNGTLNAVGSATEILFHFVQER